MLPLLKKDYWARYRDIARLLLKYGGREFVEQCGLDDALQYIGVVDASEMDGRAEELADDLEELGPTFIKLGQVLSSRADMFPPAYLRALARLQDEVEHFSYEQVEQIVERELGASPDDVFRAFDHEPLAAASLGQVHRARLKDGREVAVKVQRPGVDQTVQADLTVLHQIARILDEHSAFGHRFHFLSTIEQFRRSVLRELDYLREADHLKTLGRNVEEFARVTVPQPIEELTTSRVLTMEFVDGEKVTNVTESRLIQVDGPALADELFHAYLKQILQDGFFHADPHPGNVFLTGDGRIALMDLGMVGQIDDSLQEDLLHLLLAVSEGRSEDAAELAMVVGTPLDEFETNTFRNGIREVLAMHREQNLASMRTGELLLDVARIAGSTGLRIPPQVMLLGKALLNLDQIGRKLSPGFDPNLAIRRHAVGIMRYRTVRSLSPGQIFTNAMEMKRFASSLPRRIDRVLDNLADNELRFRVDAIDEDRLIRGVEKIANRVTVGLVLAALIVGAAMLMRVDTAFTIMGYPGFAIVAFILAAVVGLVFIGEIVWSDWRDRRKRR